MDNQHGNKLLQGEFLYHIGNGVTNNMSVVLNTATIYVSYARSKITKTVFFSNISKTVNFSKIICIRDNLLRKWLPFVRYSASRYRASVSH